MNIYPTKGHPFGSIAGLLRAPGSIAKLAPTPKFTPSEYDPGLRSASWALAFASPVFNGWSRTTKKEAQMIIFSTRSVATGQADR